MNCAAEDFQRIRNMVDAFYAKAGKDDLLGPLFSETQSSEYKEKLYQYWCKTLLRGTSDPNDCLPRNIALMFSPQHFVRWTNLFFETIDQYYSGPAAAKAKIMIFRKSHEFQSRLEMAVF